MDNGELQAVAEGLLFASGDEGVTIKQLSKVLDISEDATSQIIEALKGDYEHATRGLMLMEANGVLHLTTKPEHSSYFKKLIETPRSASLSQAALETLAIIAYQQPITRAEIDEIRGVKSDGPVQTLLNRSMIEEMGRKETIGRPILFRTSKDFLTYFGLTSIDELPPLPETTDDANNQEVDLFFERFNDELKNH
ncbi:SMC-Scp complex subunit ScpB [Oceanobacillus alkalisoli]|uniref:SMC-Scp complex subunit ScpB n=1 Tax=Oceanobacillus alkalisoli TaxID=2925113 RepID=UPI001EF081CD|nr:SMC-Scp complex subunit ScpB [Oceanobacillus alkalisoli]MCF3941684.1 SMC-Scp complex subunit ScpB [Oceanobacillus alkalisoli]MCG5102965.1 SMC-Scp complex subunit ScpB [Oceanobacillus alkalisoli]